MKKIKYIVIVIFCAILDMSFHVMTSKISDIPQNVSIVGNTLIHETVMGLCDAVPVVVIFYILPMFSYVSFQLIQNRYSDLINKQIKHIINAHLIHKSSYGQGVYYAKRNSIASY